MSNTAGWTEIAHGDWSWVHASPDGSTVVRVTPFDPGYREFVDVCSGLGSNPHVPEMLAVYDHRAGGFSVVMEGLTRTSEEIGKAFFEELRAAEVNTPLGDLRAAVEEPKPRIPLFVGLDDNPANVMCRAGTTTVLTDALGINGPELFRIITEDPEAAVQMYPAAYLAEWAHLPCMEPSATQQILDSLSPHL